MHVSIPTRVVAKARAMSEAAFDHGDFIGRLRTPWRSRSDCPKNGLQTDAVCTHAGACDGQRFS